MYNRTIPSSANKSEIAGLPHLDCQGRRNSLCVKFANPAGGSRATVLLAMAALFGCIAQPVRCRAAPQQNGSRERRSAVVTRITQEMIVDGILDEPPWQTAPKIGGMI